MKKQDTRNLSQEVQDQLRKQAIRLCKGGMKYRQVSEIVEVSANTVGIWWRNYKANGAKSLKSKRRGRRIGTGRTLNAAQEAEIQKLLLDKTPDQLKLTFALWTRQAVKELIQIRFGTKMPIRTVGDYLMRWGFTPQKPLKRAYEQRPAQVKKWLDDEYPVIAKRARKEDAEIHWGDETGLRSDCQHGRSYAPRGQTPVIRLSVKRTSVNMISAITNQGKVRFMLFDEKMNAKVLIKFMRRLIKDSLKKVFLILDNLQTHHSKIVKQWLVEHGDKIEVFHLPPYSPELNPDEYLNCDLKAGVHSQPPSRTKKGLKKKVVSHMRKIQKIPSRVVKYFTHPRIAYAG